MVNILSKEFWGDELSNPDSRRQFLQGALRGSINANQAGLPVGDWLGTVVHGGVQGLNRYDSSQAAAVADAQKAQREQQRIDAEKARIFQEQQRIRMDQQKVARELKMRQQANLAFEKMFPGFGAQEQTESQMPSPPEANAARYDQIRQSNPLFRDFTDSQIDEMQRAGAMAMAAGENPMKAMLDASKSISSRDNISVMSPEDAMDILGDAYDPTKAYKYNMKTGNITTVGGGGVEVNIGDGLTDKMKFEHYKRRMGTQGKALEAGRLAASTANDMIPRLDMIISALDSGAPTGKISELTMPLRGYLYQANALTADARENYKNQEVLQAGQNYLISRVRPEGSGQTSDMEYTSFSKAVPGLEKTPEGNKIIAKVTRQLAQYKVKEHELMQKYLSEPGNKLGDFPAYRERTIGTAIPAPKSGEEAMKVPNGTMFKNSKGKYIEMTDQVRMRIASNIGQ